MSIINQLTSRTGDKTRNSNKKVAALCLENPALLKEIAANFDTDDTLLAVDCAEVCTEVAKEKPELIVPYISGLIPLLKSKHSFARFETMHSLALTAHLVPELVESVLPDLEEMLVKDKSVIVRDHISNTLSGYAAVNAETAGKAFPYLLKVIEHWQDQHAHQAMRGLHHVYKYHPSAKQQIAAIAGHYLSSKRAVVRKETARLLKILK